MVAALTHIFLLTMAVGKPQKKVGKKGKGKKKTIDPFTRKEWYDIKAPSMFPTRNVGKTIITRTTGTKIASEGLKGRVFEINLGDLKNDEEHCYRKIQLCCEDVQGTSVLTNFHGMDLTRDKLCSLIKKWQTLIEAQVEVRTTDGYYLRVFCIGFTTKKPDQVKSTCYAKAAQVREIRRKMMEVMIEECSKCDLKELVSKFMLDSFTDLIMKATSRIFPLQNVYIRKCKVLKKPKFDLTKLMEMYTEDAGAAVARPEESAVATLPGSGGRL
jgi:small subunit ribosomal protein S3Ae